MKLKSILIIGALLASSLCLQAVGAAKPNEQRYRKAENFSELVGREVLNRQNEKLGKVKFITVDLENARLVEVVVTSGGGWFGFGATLTPVAPRALTQDADGGVLRLDVSKARFAAAPRFDESHTADATARTRVAEVIRYYGLQPWFFLDGQTVVKNAEILPLGHIERMDRILDLPISSVQRGYLGKVGTVMTDLPKGQVVHVIAVSAGMGGDNRVVVQARALHYNAARSALILDDNFKQLAGEPHFKWLNNNTFQEESYVNREVQADNGLHSKQNAQEGIVRSADAMEQGLNFRDREKTRIIMQAIQADPTLSANAKNVEVVTYHAQTTLRGHVNTIAGKTRVGEIAAKAGRPENVSNLLEVRPLR